MESMEEIYRTHAKMVYGFLLSKCGNHYVAEELTQETFYQALKGLSRFENKSSLSTWLCGIANNVYRSYCRKEKLHLELEEASEEIGGTSPEQEFFSKLDMLDLLKLLHRLKEPLREVLYLRMIGNLSFREIGEIMERSENWARVNFYRGKSRMIEEVKKNESNTM